MFRTAPFTVLEPDMESKEEKSENAKRTHIKWRLDSCDHKHLRLIVTETNRFTITSSYYFWKSWKLPPLLCQCTRIYIFFSWYHDHRSLLASTQVQYTTKMHVHTKALAIYIYLFIRHTERERHGGEECVCQEGPSVCRRGRKYCWGRGGGDGMAGVDASVRAVLHSRGHKLRSTSSNTSITTTITANLPPTPIPPPSPCTHHYYNHHILFLFLLWIMFHLLTLVLQ